MKKPIKGYKAFNKDMTCKGFQYEEGKTYECNNAKCCQEGFHLVLDPLDALTYYNIVDSVFCEVEALGKIDKNKHDTKISTTKIRIGSKLDLKAYIKASIDFCLSTCKSKKQASSGDYAMQASGEYGATQASGGDYAKQVSGGNYAKQVSSGNYATQVSSGDSAKQTSGGDGTTQVSSGCGAKQTSSGYGAMQVSSGYSATQASSGDSAKQVSSGNYAKQASGGNYAMQASGGNYAKQVSGGDCATQASSGYSATQSSSGDYAKQASSGNYTTQELNGKDSVAVNAGHNGKVKAKIGCWICLSEWKQRADKSWYPAYVKAGQIDGKNLKENVWYKLKGGKFVPVH